MASWRDVVDEALKTTEQRAREERTRREADAQVAAEAVLDGLHLVGRELEALYTRLGSRAMATPTLVPGARSVALLVGPHAIRMESVGDPPRALKVRVDEESPVEIVFNRLHNRLVLGREPHDPSFDLSAYAGELIKKWFPRVLAPGRA